MSILKEITAGRAAIAIVAAIVLIDMFLVATGHETISGFIYRLSLSYPAIPFAVGFVCGHVFWPVGGPR